jgi:hypothetical protein
MQRGGERLLQLGGRRGIECCVESARLAGLHG